MVILPYIRKKDIPNYDPAAANKVPLSECVITLSRASVEFSGEPVSVDVTVTWGGVALRENHEYQLSWGTNIDIGDGTVEVIGIGLFTGIVRKTFSIVPMGNIVAPNVWNDFDLALTSLPVAAVVLGVYAANMVKSMQTINDNRILVSGGSADSVLLLGFDDGHPFSIEHFSGILSEVPVSVTGVNNVNFTWSGQRLVVARSGADDGGIYMTGEVDQAFTLPESQIQPVDLSRVGGGLRQLGLDGYSFVKLARDGKHVALKGNAFTSSVLVVEFQTPHLYLGHDYAQVSSFNLNEYEVFAKAAGADYGTWSDFLFSDDGSVFVSICGKSVVQISLMTPWDVSSADLYSFKAFPLPVNDSLFTALAINSTGSKMLLFNNHGTMLYEFNLRTASSPAQSQVPMSGCEVTLAADTVMFNGPGEAHTVGVTVSWLGFPLTAGTDYTLTYSNNTGIGTATVTVTSTGTGRIASGDPVTKNFTIEELQDWSSVVMSHAIHAASAEIKDGNDTLVPYHLQPLSNSQLFFVDSGSHKAYIWGFETGHLFEVEHLASTYVSRSSRIGSFDLSSKMFAALSSDGNAIAYSTSNYGKFWTRPLTTAFDLSELGSQTEKTLSANNLRIQLSKNGERFYIKGHTGSIIYRYNCASAYNYASPTLDDSISLASFESDVKTAAVISGSAIWNDFCFSDDEKILMASMTINGTDVIARFNYASSNWSLHSVFKPSDASGVQAIAFNSDGTKMLLFCTSDNKLHEYDLV